MIDNLEVRVIKSIEGIESIRSIWEEMQAKETYPKVSADIDRYLSVIKTADEETQPYILLLNQNNDIVCMLIGYIRKSPIKCNLGRNTLFKPSLQTLNVVYGGILGNPSEDIHRFLIKELIKLARSGEIDVVCFNHLKTDSLIYKAARKVPGLFCRSYFPKIESHVVMSIPRDTEQFLQSCSRRRRKHIRKYLKRLEKEYPGKVTMSVYSKEDEVEYAIETAARISSQTYQRAFGGGVVNDERTKILWRNAAEKGWLRVYILSIDNEPCTFRYVLKYRGTYFAEVIGYLPKWKDYNVGTVLFTKFLEKICREPDFERIDFSFGGGYHKEMGESFSWPEASVYIFAPRFFPVMVNIVRSFTSAISIFAQYLITKLGIFHVVQQFRRRKVVKKNLQHKEYTEFATNR